MRDPFGLNERLFARWYPLVCGLSERAGQRDMRNDALATASGVTLEIGAGSGLNLAHYTAAVTQLILTEPSPHMRRVLTSLAAAEPPGAGAWSVVDGTAEAIAMPDASVDTVVGTYVLCSVTDPSAVLTEIGRVLRPGGTYLFMEHVHEGEGTWLGRAQDLLEIPHRYVAAGCHPNRRTEDLLDASPLSVLTRTRTEMPRAFPTVRPVLIGSATLTP